MAAPRPPPAGTRKPGDRLSIDHQA